MSYKTFGWEGTKWILIFHFQTWMHISLGIHIYPPAPNVEIHLPFGFIRVGRKPTRYCKEIS